MVSREDRQHALYTRFLGSQAADSPRLRGRAAARGRGRRLRVGFLAVGPDRRGGHDRRRGRRRDDRRRGDARRSTRSSSSRCARRSRSPSTTSSTSSAPRSSRSTPTSTGWSTRRSRRAGGRAADPRLALRHRRRGRRRDLAAGHLLQQGDRRVHRQGRRGGQQRAGQRDDRADRGRRSRASRARTGVAVDEAALRSRVESAVQRPENRKVTAPVETVEPEVTKEELAAQYPTYLTVEPIDLRAHPVEGPRAGEDLHGRDRRRRVRHPRRRLQHPEQGGRPRLERPGLRLGGRASPGPRSRAACPRTR